MDEKVVPFRRVPKTVENPNGGKPIPVAGWMCAKCGQIHAPETLHCPCETKPVS